MNETNTLWLFDLDRTLINTERLNHFYVDAVATITKDDDLVQSLHKEWREREAAGLPYLVVSQLSRTMSETQIDVFDTYLLEHIRPDEFLEPGATILLEAVTTKGLRHGIMTYGPPDRQRFKLRLAGLDYLPHIITDTPDKADIIREWRQDDLFVPPTHLIDGSFQSVALLDDKAVAFSNLPDGMKGFLYRPGDAPLLKSQEGTVSDRVQEIRHLEDMIAFLG